MQSKMQREVLVRGDYAGGGFGYRVLGRRVDGTMESLYAPDGGKWGEIMDNIEGH